MFQEPSLRRPRLCGAPLRAAPRPGNVRVFASRAQGSLHQRFPGAAQHAVVRCRPGIVPGSNVSGAELAQTPDQRCTAALRCALHRVRGTSECLLPGRRAASISVSRAQRSTQWCAADPGSSQARMFQEPSLRRPRLCGAPLRAAPRPGNVRVFASRAQRSTQWCAADPGSSQARMFQEPSLRRPRISGAPLRFAARCTASGERGL